MSGKVKYTVITKTSKDYKSGATDADVFILMIGKKGTSTSEWIKLDNLFRDDFELGRIDKFSIKVKDVGLPEVIRLKIEKAKDRDGWLCDTVIVQHPSLGQVFFCVYDIVMDEISVRTGPASLPQRETSPLYRDMRRLEINRNKAMYDWHLLPTENDVGWDLPRFCKAEVFEELPLLFQANDVQYDNFQGNREKVLFNTLAEHMSRKVHNNTFKSFDDFKEIFHLKLIPQDMPPFIDRWKLDEELGRQMLSGVNPTVITRCRELPEEFVKDEERIFGDKETCAKELEAKHLYWINYRGVFDGLKRNKSKGGAQLYCTDSICLFQVGSDKQLRPIAIQLEKDGYVFTPKDQEHDWMLAKMYFRNSDANVHEFQSHLLRTHIVIEPIGVALFQCLSRHHPIYKLLRPHLQTVAAINTLGRTFLIGPDAAANFTLSINGLDMTRHSFINVTFDDLIIPNVFKEKGTDDAEALPHYNYREDSLRLWDAIERYASNVVQYYYKTDVDVTEDPELCDFIRTVAEEGIGWNGKGTKGFPVKLDTVKDLIQYCTIIIFTSSVQHAASNFGQFEIYKFCPNAPAGMRLPPHKKGEGSMKRILDSLPNPIMACLQVGTSFTLSSFSPNEIFLGDYTTKFFTEEAVLTIQDEFSKDLNDISKAIQKRNELLEIPYTFLLPEKIPNSIAV